MCTKVSFPWPCCGRKMSLGVRLKASRTQINMSIDGPLPSFRQIIKRG